MQAIDTQEAPRLRASFIAITPLAAFGWIKGAKRACEIEVLRSSLDERDATVRLIALRSSVRWVPGRRVSGEGDLVSCSRAKANTVVFGSVLFIVLDSCVLFWVILLIENR